MFCIMCDKRRGQTIVEYSLLLGIVAVVISTMGPLVQRSMKGMVKVVSDQIGVQENAEQSFDERGHLDESRTRAEISTEATYMEDMGDIGHGYNDRVFSHTTSYTNMGYQEKRQ